MQHGQRARCTYWLTTDQPINANKMDKLSVVQWVAASCRLGNWRECKDVLKEAAREREWQVASKKKRDVRDGGMAFGGGKKQKGRMPFSISSFHCFTFFFFPFIMVLMWRAFMPSPPKDTPSSSSSSRGCERLELQHFLPSIHPSIWPLATLPLFPRFILSPLSTLF